MARVPAVPLLAGVLAGVLAALCAPPLARAQGCGGDSGALKENIRRVIREGSADLGLPVLDPLRIENLNTSIEEPRSYDLTGLLRNVVATGLGDFDATIDTALSGINVDVTVVVTIPLLEAEGGYSFDALLGEVVHLYGDGNFQLKVYELEVTVIARVRILPINPLRSVTTSINVKDFEFELDGLLEGGLVDSIFNLAVNELAKVIFKEQKAVLEAYLAEVLFDPIESVINSFGVRDILCLLVCQFCPSTDGVTNSSNNV